MFSHWISSSVKNIQAHSGLTPYLLAMTIKERDVFFHWISSSVKNIQAHSGLEIITRVSLDLPCLSIHLGGLDPLTTLKNGQLFTTII